MMKHEILTGALLAVTALAYGQNLNPTVEVTNAYEGGAEAIKKPLQVMQVPDSVTRFNLDFDYEVFDNPYRGAYEFRPYQVQLRPQPAASGERKFYLRAGAGYRLRPELELVYTPLRRNDLEINLTASHRSFIDRYRPVGADFSGEDVRLLRRDLPDSFSDAGLDLKTRLGADGRYGWAGGEATLALAYDNLVSRHSYLGISNLRHGALADARVRSLGGDTPGFFYDASLSYRYGYNRPTDLDASETIVNHGSEFRFATSLGPVMENRSAMLLDAAVGIQRLSGNLTAFVGNLAVTPHYRFETGNWHFDLGVRLSTFFHEDGTDGFVSGEGYASGGQHVEMFTKQSQRIYPAVSVEWTPLGESVIFQAAARGGDTYNSYFDLVEKDHFFSQFYTFAGYPFLDNSVERIHAFVGARGNIARRFGYDWKVGFMYRDHELMYGAGDVKRDELARRPTLGYADYAQMYTDLKMAWRSSSVEADACLRYNYTWMQEVNEFFAPAPFKGNVSAYYLWGERLKAGLDADFSTARKSGNSVRDSRPVAIPGYLDLGLYGEYAWSRKTGVWLRIGNLLNQTIQRIPFIAESGIYATAGIRLNF